VADNGRGFSQALRLPQLGQAIIEALARDIGATVTICSSCNGTAVVILFPADGETRSKAEAASTVVAPGFADD